MSKRMLIDASHPEETRVVVLDGHKIEEFDFESASKRPLKGNIYLAKVTRVEPSLQAAFVEYGGNRQGFLAFSEIHPDYYQIPVADRIALIAEQSRRLKEEDEDGFDSIPTGTASAEAGAESGETGSGEPGDNFPPADGGAEHDDDDDRGGRDDEDHEGDGHEGHEHDDESEHAEGEHDHNDHDDEHGHDDHGHSHEASEDSHGDEPHASHEDSSPSDGSASENQDAGSAVIAESTGVPEPAQRRSPREERQRRPRRRQYKIQEVIKRRQIILVQVVKEERGNKGASLTTFLSLAGRYCVLMPNTPRGGGISRKITSATDRRRLKSAAQSLELPEGMGLIIRTAGANRTKVEIKRDYEYLLRLWDSVRELTLRSNAPALVYEEGNIIKRAIRDLYNKDISEVLVEGDDGYRDAKDFMRMLMPSHAKNVKPYKDPMPLFQQHHAEAQLDAMFSPTVTLKSGGYIVINQTEALVSIDVNSGKATREHNIEDTALKTNLEAADEVGRQLRLRDLAGLIVIDFIDMEDGKNDRHVEKRIRDAVRGDRARVQIGKISQFGLLEMSRQRLRAGVIAGSTVTCPHCGGQGLVRSTESAALRLLRALDEEGQRAGSANMTVKAPEDIIIYTLNQKRREIARIEDAYNLGIMFEPAAGMMGGSFEVTRTGQRVPVARKPAAVSVDAGFVTKEDLEDENVVDDTEISDEEMEQEENAFTETPDETVPDVPQEASPDRQENGGEMGENGRKRRRRRRRGGRGRGERGEGQRDGTSQPREQREPRAAQENSSVSPSEDGEAADGDFQAEANGDIHSGEQPAPQTHGEGGRKRRRRRGRRGRRHDGDTVQNGERTPHAESHADSSADTQTTPWRDSVTPNTPSEPQWSLGSEAAEGRSQQTEAAEGRSQQTEAAAGGSQGNEAAAGRSQDTQTEDAARPPRPVMPEAEAPAQARKGWWSRKLNL